MSRILFTVEADVYELTPGLKKYFIDQSIDESTLDAWFEGTRLYQERTVTVGGEDSIETEWADVVETFQTLPTEAKKQLQEAGADPIVDAKDGLFITESNGGVNVHQHV